MKELIFPGKTFDEILVDVGGETYVYRDCKITKVDGNFIEFVTFSRKRIICDANRCVFNSKR